MALNVEVVVKIARELSGRRLALFSVLGKSRCASNRAGEDGLQCLCDRTWVFGVL